MRYGERLAKRSLHQGAQDQAQRVLRYSFPRSGRVKELAAGELLDERRRDDGAITSMTGPGGMSTRTAAAQLYQSPSNDEGVRFKRAWWRELPMPPEGRGVSVWSWDTAVKDKQQADWSVGTLIYVFPLGFFIQERVRDRLEYPALKREIRNRYGGQPTDFILVEDKSSGQQIIQDLSQPPEDGAQVLPIIGTDPVFNKLDKSSRAALVEPEFEVGKVYLWRGQKWVTSLQDEFSEFPNGDHDDQVDSVVHGIWFLKQHLKAKQAPPPDEHYEESGASTMDDGL